MYHVEVRIAQCLDSRMCVVGIIVRFLTGSRETFFYKTCKPALDPTNLPTQLVRGPFPEPKQPECETENYRSADKSLARPTSQSILFAGENISFDASLVIYINSTNISQL